MTEENQTLTCRNPKCNRTFDNPILIRDYKLGEIITYSGCPYCFSKIKEIQELQPEEPEPIQQSTQKCPGKFGYLSNRSRGKDIPEECLTCKKLIACMLYKKNPKL